MYAFSSLWVSANGATPRAGAAITPRPTNIRGAHMPSKYSSVKGRGFSVFEYFEQLPSEAPSPRAGPPSAVVLRNASPRSSPRRVEASPLGDRPVFKHCALPPAPQQAGAFQRFRYAEDPYELLQDHKRQELRDFRSKAVGGAFSAGGNARDTRRNLKQRMPVRARATA